MEKKKASKVMERQVVTYLDKDVFEEFDKSAKAKGGKSKAGHRAVMDYYNSMCPKERKCLADLWDEMTDEQRKNPRKFEK